MKKTFLLGVALFSLLQLKAQDAHFGVKGGLNASSLNYSGSTEMQTKIGFNLGVLAHIHTSNENWAVQPELYYSSEGAKSKSDGNNSLNLGYLNLPVLLQYMFGNGFRVEAGPQAGFLVNAKAKSGNTSIDVKHDLQSAVFSIPLGLGYLAANGIGFDARYDFGISNIYKSDYGQKVHSNVFEFDVFYQFSHSRR